MDKNRIWPIPGHFLPKKGRLSVNDGDVWNETQMRNHLGKQKKFGTDEFKDPDEYGFVALPKNDVDSEESCHWEPSEWEGNDEIPPNPSHCDIIADQSPDVVAADLYAIALGYAPAPRLSASPEDWAKWTPIAFDSE